jgi:hypothetical protein
MVDATYANLGGLWGGPQDQGALWNALTGNGQWNAAPAPSQEAPDQPHGLLGRVPAKPVLGGLFGDSARPADAPAQPQATAQPQADQQPPGQQDPIAQLIAQNKPSRLQTLLHAWGTGQDFNTAQADLTERNIQTRMLPAKIAADLQQAQINAALRGRVLQGLSPQQQAPAGSSPPGGVQTASARGAQPSQAVPGAAASQAPADSGFPIDLNTLGLMSLNGDKNAQAVMQAVAPDIEIDRASGGMVNKKTGQVVGYLDRSEYVNGQLVNPHAKGAPGFVPQYAAGTMPDGKGGVIPIPGYAGAAAEAAGAVAGAQEAAKAPYDTVVIQTPQGPLTVSKAQLAALQGGGAPQPQATPAPVANPNGASQASGGARSITPQQAMQFYIAKGYKPEQAAGLVGNLIGESGLDAGRTADDGSFGLAQWTGPRLQGLFAFAKANKLDPSDPNTQLEYSHYELQNGEKSAGDALRNAGTVGDATAAAVGYERPAGYTPQNPQGASHYGQRLSAAQQLVTGPGGATAQPAPPNKPFIAQGVSPDIQKADQDAISKLRDTANDRRFLATRANEFVNKMGDLATGPGYEGIHIPLTHSEFNPVRDVAGWFPNPGNQLDELDAISNATWADMRQKGSGAIKGYEAGDWKQAFPNIRNRGPANVGIAQRLTDEANQTEKQLAFYEGWLQKYGSLSANGGADAAWSKTAQAHNAQAGQGQPQPPKRAPALPKAPPKLPQPNQAQRTPPAAAIADLKRDPSPQAKAEFDQVFGVGSAKRALGGA